MKRHASIWTCGALALCALLACAVSAAGLLYGTRWALLAPGALLGIAPGLAAAASGGRSRLRPAGLALGALLGLGIAVLGGPVRAGLWSNALQRPQAALVCGALLGSAWSAGAGGRVDARGGWLSGGLTLAVALAGLALSAGTPQRRRWGCSFCPWPWGCCCRRGLRARGAGSAWRWALRCWRRWALRSSGRWRARGTGRWRR